jgi:lipopolysaccharide/colanic/teichoic acid biosynthesis glycosyltransferase
MEAPIPSTTSHDFYRRWGKRILDLFLSLFGLVVLSPFLIFIFILVHLRLGSPVLFRQVRPGFGGRPFTLFKFRTMRDLRDPEGNLLPDEARLPGFGRFLRRMSLDELPELFTVLKGDMSLVGPRPLLPQYLDRYTPEQARRHEAKPGLTGWAQVHGRNAINWEEKFALDVWYVDNRSFWLDLKILAMTAWKVLRREGISAEGEATMPEFMGTVSNRGKSENV